MPTSWKAEMFVQGEWSSNAQRYATEAEAEGAGANLYARWTLVDKYQTTATEDPVNATYVQGTGSQPVASPAEAVPAALPDAAE